MTAFLGKRIAQIVPTLLLVSVLVFCLQQLMPGDPAMVLAGEERGDPRGVDRPVQEGQVVPALPEHRPADRPGGQRGDGLGCGHLAGQSLIESRPRCTISGSAG